MNRRLGLRPTPWIIPDNDSHRLAPYKVHMQPPSRHQCLIYSGSPARHLPALAALMRRKLEERHRCLYLDSPPMVAGMRSYLAAAGVDVAREVGKGSLVLSSDQGHLVDGHFDVGPDARLPRRSSAAGSERWLSGPVGDGRHDLGIRLQERIGQAARIRMEARRAVPPAAVPFGICQYHVDTLPPEAVRQGLLTHPSLFINETLSRMNPHYLPRERVTAATPLPDFRDLVEDS